MPQSTTGTYGGLLDAIVNVSNLVPAFTLLLYVISFLGGLYFIVKAFRMLTQITNSGGRVSVPVIITYLSIGTLLVSLNFLIPTLLSTFFGSGQMAASSSIFDQAPQTIGVVTNEATKELITSIIRIVQFIGFIGIIRGFFMVAAYADQKVQTIGPAITFIIAGVMGINFPRVVGMFENLFLNS